MIQGHSRDSGTRKLVMRFVCLFAALALWMVATPALAQRASLSELKRTSPRLPTDTQMECAELRASLVQLAHNVDAIDGELSAGEAAMKKYTELSIDEGMLFVDARHVDVDAPRDLRNGMRRLEEIRRIAEWRIVWLSDLEQQRGCRAEVLITD